MAYALRAGISFCQIDRRLLFLDVDADRYFALARPAEDCLLRTIEKRGPSGDDEATLQRLAERNIVVPVPGNEHRIMACAGITDPDRSLLEIDCPEPTTWQVMRAIAGFMGSIVRVKTRSLQSNLAVAVDGRDPLGARDDVSLGMVARAHDRAGLLLSLHDRCLAQSLAVMRRSVDRGAFAQLVLGVTLGPFSAHCWVQSGKTLINDRLDRVEMYTPILVV